MADMIESGPVSDAAGIREAVCIHTRKIFDSCRDKDCVEDLRLYPTAGSQAVIDRAISLKAGRAELLYAYIDVEPVGFNRGFYTVDVRYFYRVTADAFVGAARPVPISGLAVFEKRVILFGSEGSAKVFSSTMSDCDLDAQHLPSSNLPVAVVEAVDPLILGIKLTDSCDCGCSGGEGDASDVPAGISNCFSERLNMGGEGRKVFVTLGQFSIIRLERDSQLLIPAYDYCVPEKECAGGKEEDPCAAFRRVQFPMEEFFPPNTTKQPEDYQDAKNCCACT
ncbi:MAG: hypothetical protein ACI4OU_05775 [Candidatus Enterenecus sp.]